MAEGRGFEMKTKRRYGQWAGDPNGFPEDESRCIVEVYPSGGILFPHQCLRKRGYGSHGLYCKQHARKFSNQDN